MGVMKRRHTAGERAHPIAGCAAMSQMSDQPAAFPGRTGSLSSLRVRGLREEPLLEAP